MEEEIKKDLKEHLKEKRYQHSLNVMEEASNLAKHYHIDEEKCRLCGLIHDIAKEFTNEENEKFIKDHNLDKSLLESDNKKLVHGYIAAIIAKEKYGFTNDMVKAIKYHTTGYPNMDLLGKIVYLADKIEKGRNYPGIIEERTLAYQNIDKAIILCLNNQINKLKKENKKINPLSYQTLKSIENSFKVSSN